jgi:uncharacterized protein YdhG (YjbR/CyaY superfamily)
MSSKKASGTSGGSDGGFSAAEKAAMRERAKELKAEARANRKREAGEADVQAKIAEMPAGDRALAERIHALVTAAAPELVPRTWYGMPAYTREGKVVCFFQAGSKFESRYCTFGFQDAAALDEGGMWPTAFALTRLTRQDEAAITAMVRKAVG